MGDLSRTESESSATRAYVGGVGAAGVIELLDDACGFVAASDQAEPLRATSIVFSGDEVLLRITDDARLGKVGVDRVSVLSMPSLGSALAGRTVVVQMDGAKNARGLKPFIKAGTLFVTYSSGTVLVIK